MDSTWSVDLIESHLHLSDPHARPGGNHVVFISAVRYRPQGYEYRPNDASMELVSILDEHRLFSS